MKKEELKQAIDTLREGMKDAKSGDGPLSFDMKDFDTDSFSSLFSSISGDVKEGFGAGELPLEIEYKATGDPEQVFADGTLKVHTPSDDILILEAATSDGSNDYTSLLALTEKNGSLIVSFLPTMTEDMREIRDVVMGSLPMIIGVILLAVLVLSFLYSRGIIKPLFASLEDKNRELDEKNRELEKENERQEMFLRATSHQLKTPLSGALLLTEGMMGNVGKYSDRDQYLPKLKEQLVSMRTIIDEVLSLHGRAGRTEMSDVRVKDLTEGLVSSYRIRYEEKRISIDIKSEGDPVLHTDSELLVKILDNLISNAVTYCPEGGRVDIGITPGRITVTNPGHIEESILEHVREPFVTGSSSEGHGLGLYIASYYAGILGCGLNVANGAGSVTAELEVH